MNELNLAVDPQTASPPDAARVNELPLVRLRFHLDEETEVNFQ